MSNPTDRENIYAATQGPTISSAVDGCMTVNHVSAKLTIPEKNSLSRAFSDYAAYGGPAIAAAVDGCMAITSKETLGISFTEAKPVTVILPTRKR